jgi:hypothetical protein
MYAHALIELGDRTIQRGEEVYEDDFTPDDWAALVEGGALSDDEYDEKSDEVPMPDEVVIDGIRYKKEPSNA